MSTARMLQLALRLAPSTSSSATLIRAASARRTLSTTIPRRADPWLLPGTPEHVAKTTSPLDAPAPEPLERHGETVERMRARLVYQSRKRGTLESDLLLSTFAAERLGTMSEGELKEFDKVRLSSISSSCARNAGASEDGRGWHEV